MTKWGWFYGAAAVFNLGVALHGPLNWISVFNAFGAGALSVMCFVEWAENRWRP